MTSTTLEQLLQKVQDLPPLPVLATRIVSMLQEQDLSAQDLARVVSNEPSMVARVMRVANSPFYGIPTQIKTVQHAVVVLGQRAFGCLVLALAIPNQLQSPSGSRWGRYSHEQFWQRSLLSAICAQRMVEQCRPAPMLSAEAFLGGLLHNIGELVLAVYHPLGVKTVLEIEQGHPAGSPCDHERTVLGFDHQILGGAILEHWKLPPSCVEAAGRHHQIGAPDTDPPQHPLVEIVQTADELLNLVAADPPPTGGLLVQQPGQAPDPTKPWRHPRLLDEIWRELPKLTKEAQAMWVAMENL